MTMFNQDQINPGQPWAVKIQRQAIAAFFPKNVFYDNMGEKVSLPDGMNAYSWPLMDQPEISSIDAIKLIPGVTPTTTDNGFSQVPVRPEQYGEYTSISDIMLADSPIDLVANVVKTKSAVLAAKVDRIVQNKLNEGLNVIYAGGSATRVGIAATSVLTIPEIGKAKTILENGFAPEFDESGYLGIISNNQYNDLVTNPVVGGFLDVAKYSQPEKIWRGEVGKVLDVKIVKSNNIAAFLNAGATGQNIFPAYFMGKEAFGIIEKDPLQIVIKPIGSGGGTDPLNQRATVGVKIRFGVTLIKPESLVRLETSSSVNSTAAALS